MIEESNPGEMADPTKMIKISSANYDRLKKYGFAGESINTALQRVLDALEKDKQK
jgi:hypothetical protein